jgi:hypothetical protein
MNPGDTLSRYRIVALVGEVYKAEDTRLKRPVAIKVLTPALSDNADAKQRLIVEAQAASALDHPNICTIYEIDETPDGRLFLAMAYYEGETLARRIARGALGIAFSMRAIDAAAAGRDRARLASRHSAAHRRHRAGEAARLRHRQARRSNGRNAHRIDGRHRSVHGARAHRGARR